jgi:hypothetical protein
MVRRVSSTSSSRLLRLGFAAAIAVACASSFVGAKFVLSYLLASSTAGIGGLRDIAEIDYLFIGSSHTRQGYSAEVLEAETGKSVYVLSYNGLDAVFMRELLVHLIEERHLRIGRVVIEAYSINAASPPALRDYRLFNDAPPALKRRFLSVLERNAQLDWRRIYELLVLGGNEQLLAAPIVNPLVVDPSSFRGSYRGKTASGLDPDVFPYLSRYVPSDLKPEVHPEQRVAWQAIFQLVRDHGLDADFVEVPMPSSIVATPGIADARRALAELLAESGFRYVDLSTEGLFDANDPKAFADWNHLSTDGRDAYTRAFVHWLQARSD